MKPITRTVSTSFWEDDKVVNMFSPEDKYFYLYLLTNPHTTQLGVYRLVPKIAAFETGYSVEAIIVLLDRFESKYDMIKYSKETCEVAIKNYLKHSIIKGGKPVMDCLLKEEKEVKDRSLLKYIYNNLSNNNNLNITVEEYIKHLNDINNNDNDNDNERIVDESSTNRGIDLSDFFERVWKLYPRKEGKGQVSEAKKKHLLNKVGEEQLIRCIERYKKAKRGCDPKFIMHGSTFFNSGYVDYLDENVGQSTETAPKKQEPKTEQLVGRWKDEWDNEDEDAV